MTAWLVIGAIAAGSFAMRASMLVLVTSHPLPSRVQEAMGFVGPAAVAALVATLVLTQDGAVRAVPVAEGVALVSAFAVVRRTGNALHAVAVGFPVLWVLGALGW